MNSAVLLRVCGVAACLITLAAEPSRAGFVSALEKFTVKYEGKDPASAFSIVVSQIAVKNVVTAKSDKFPLARKVDEAEGLRLTFRNDDKPINPGDKITVEIVFTFPGDDPKAMKFVDRTKIAIQVQRSKSGFYDSLDNDNAPLKLRPLIPGIKASGDPIYNLLNDDPDSGLDLRDLQLLANVAEIDPDMLDPLDPKTFGTPIGNVMLPAGLDVASNDFDSGPVDPGNWFYVRGQIYDENGDNVGAFIQGFQTQVPEPGAAVLMSLGLVLMGGGRYARRKRASAMRCSSQPCDPSVAQAVLRP